MKARAFQKDSQSTKIFRGLQMLKQLNKLQIALILLLCAAVVSVGCEKKKKNNSDALLGYILAYNQLNSQAFNYSCNTAASKLCTNYFGNTPQLSQSQCATNGGTASSSACTTGSLGACNSGGTNYTQTVFYSGNSTCASTSACQTYCTSTVGGTFVTYWPDLTRPSLGSCSSAPDLHMIRHAIVCCSSKNVRGLNRRQTDFIEQIKQIEDERAAWRLHAKLRDKEIIAARSL
jgi:hypothetical protein